MTTARGTTARDGAGGRGARAGGGGGRAGTPRALSATGRRFGADRIGDGVDRRHGRADGRRRMFPLSRYSGRGSEAAGSTSDSTDILATWLDWPDHDGRRSAMPITPSPRVS